ncbi:MAG: hypothetical protein ACHQU1_11480 [Gemmatimonadales bacterium]
MTTRSAAALLALLVTYTALAAQERAVQASRVPAAVREALARAYPTATALHWTSEREHGRTIYEVESTDGAIHRDLQIVSDGTIIETETQVAPEQLPPAVRSAAAAAGGRIRIAEVVVTGRDTVYEIKRLNQRGELRLLRDGTKAPAEP